MAFCVCLRVATKCFRKQLWEAILDKIQLPIWRDSSGWGFSDPQICHAESHRDHLHLAACSIGNWAVVSRERVVDHVGLEYARLSPIVAVPDLLSTKLGTKGPHLCDVATNFVHLQCNYDHSERQDARTAAADARHAAAWSRPGSASRDCWYVLPNRMRDVGNHMSCASGITKQSESVTCIIYILRIEDRYSSSKQPAS